MQVKEVDPYKVNVDEMNERKENLNLAELEKSVAEQGVIQPPIVRERNGDAEVPYSVVVGQRRTLAAQGVGLDAMPVVVMGWDNRDALEASITENIDGFREDVTKKDRALAIQRLKELHGWDSNQKVADHLGVDHHAVTYWLEPLKEEWEGTILDPDVIDETNGDAHSEQYLEKVSDDAIEKIRVATGGGEAGEELIKKAAKHDLSRDDVRELARKIKKGRKVDEALAQTIEEKHSSDGIKVSANVTFSGDHAGALTTFAKDRGMTENEIVRQAITDFLEREGYL